MSVSIFWSSGLVLAPVEVGENAIDPAEEIARFLQGDDGVFKSRRFLIAGDRFDLLQVIGHALRRKPGVKCSGP